jgi:hypothetical protein
MALAMQYARSWSFVERFYLPVYAKTWVHGLFPKAQTRYNLIAGVTAKLTTTELYTRVSINLLKQVYLATHPGAHGKPAGIPVTERNAEAEAELLATLAAEAEEEDSE